MNNKEIKWEIKEIAPGMVEIRVSPFGKIATIEDVKRKANELLGGNTKKESAENLIDGSMNPDIAEGLLLKEEIAKQEGLGKEIHAVKIVFDGKTVIVNSKNLNKAFPKQEKRTAKIPNEYGNNPNIKIMTADKHKDIYPNADYFVDLENIKTLPEDKFDCIIATQVIMYMKDVVKTLENLKYMLKPNGVLILTVPGPLFHHSKNSHHMFSFTEESIKYLCQKVFNNYENFQYYGNLEYTQYMLYWMKKNHYWGEDDNEYLYTLVMGITAKNITK